MIVSNIIFMSSCNRFNLNSFEYLMHAKHVHWNMPFTKSWGYSSKEAHNNVKYETTGSREREHKMTQNVDVLLKKDKLSCSTSIAFFFFLF